MYKICAACNKCKKIPTFYKPSADVVNGPYFKHVYGKTNYVYATLELYGNKSTSHLRPTPPAALPPTANPSVPVAAPAPVVGGVVVGC